MSTWESILQSLIVFDYFLFMCVVALVGLTMLSVVVRRYKCRERDDRPYNHKYIIEAFGHDIEERRLEESIGN